ncbi:MAG TPA: fructosamine kinase family protein [Brumimicrobium sp.]|nr:fructosamine kinase family protein [Brumimicrobium sp.]
MKESLNKLASQNNLNLIEAYPLSGGDINEVFLLKCAEGKFVVKINNASRFPKMFIAEAKGLALLENSKSFKIPKQLTIGTLGKDSYLLMEYIVTGIKSGDFWKEFASKLVKLHKTSQPLFGLDFNNYIGSLPQQNQLCDTATEFYISQRLEPQFRLAYNNGFKFENLSSFYKNISKEIPEETPSLIHGDLWGGNYMVSKKGEAVLIDPAVAFAPREMDIAMMKLFGGFTEEVFIHYNSLYPLVTGWEERIKLWQLYYLLVHLNLFGASYLPQVKSIISKYS